MSEYLDAPLFALLAPLLRSLEVTRAAHTLVSRDLATGSWTGNRFQDGGVARHIADVPVTIPNVDPRSHTAEGAEACLDWPMKRVPLKEALRRVPLKEALRLAAAQAFYAHEPLRQAGQSRDAYPDRSGTADVLFSLSPDEEPVVSINEHPLEAVPDVWDRYDHPLGGAWAESIEAPHTSMFRAISDALKEAHISTATIQIACANGRRAAPQISFGPTPETPEELPLVRTTALDHAWDDESSSWEARKTVSGDTMLDALTNAADELIDHLSFDWTSGPKGSVSIVVYGHGARVTMEAICYKWQAREPDPEQATVYRVREREPAAEPDGPATGF